MAERIRIGVLYGGRSSEHEVSIQSATNVIAALDRARYDVLPIHVGRDGRWLVGSLEGDGKSLTRPEAGEPIALVPGGRGRLVVAREMVPAGSGPAASVVAPAALDVLFPVLHGIGGEDGSVQGHAEVAGVAYVGCSILGSAAALDKEMTKRLLSAAGLPVANSVTIRKDGTDIPAFDAIAADLGLPIFVKPVRQGSSVGVSKVADAAAYAAALELGFAHDARLLAEEAIPGREIELSVIEDPAGGDLFVSRPGEIVTAAGHGFYSYDAKYIDAAGARIEVPAAIDVRLEERLKELAAKVFRAVGCEGMARVDFFVTREDRIVVNEVNTIPGFTDISMFPKALMASGFSYAQILDRLIDHALERGRRAAG